MWLSGRHDMTLVNHDESSDNRSRNVDVRHSLYRRRAKKCYNTRRWQTDAERLTSRRLQKTPYVHIRWATGSRTIRRYQTDAECRDTCLCDGTQDSKKAYLSLGKPNKTTLEKRRRSSRRRLKIPYIAYMRLRKTQNTTLANRRRLKIPYIAHMSLGKPQDPSANQRRALQLLSSRRRLKILIKPRKVSGRHMTRHWQTDA
jgi:hypothetical protein